MNDWGVTMPDEKKVKAVMMVGSEFDALYIDGVKVLEQEMITMQDVTEHIGGATVVLEYRQLKMRYPDRLEQLEGMW